ncbi:MAG: CBS domain-containing protein [Deltaproteobacteria bacterium]|nr:CBS domain-containing protein [Deltaproteobacteria bacterium]
MKVRDIMTSNVFSVKSYTDLNFAELATEVWHIRHIPVVDEEEQVIGLLSTRDIAEYLAKPNANHFLPVNEIMSKEVSTTTPETDLKQIAAEMYDNKIGAMPVVDDGKLIGIISERDFIKAFLKK